MRQEVLNVLSDLGVQEVPTEPAGAGGKAIKVAGAAARTLKVMLERGVMRQRDEAARC